MNIQETFAHTLQLFIRSMTANNRSANTVTAYSTDIRQFLTYLQETDGTLTHPRQVERNHITEYLAHLSDLGRTGVTRARKLNAIREYFTFLTAEAVISQSPASTIAMPKKEKKKKTYLRQDEYNHLLAVAGNNPRDFAIIQIFLQTGIRVSELIAIQLGDLDLNNKTIKIHGKGKKERTIDLEKKGIQAIKSYLAVRKHSSDTHLFLNYEGNGFSVRGIRKIVDKYLLQADIQKQIGCHGLRHTFATAKARKGINAFQLKEWLGHERITTSLEYVHLSEMDTHIAMEQTSL